MMHDVAFANPSLRSIETSLSSGRRAVSGPPMFRMLAVALVAGALLAIGATLSGAGGFAVGLGVGWCGALAVLAIETALYSRWTASRFSARCSAIGWSSLGAAS